MSLTATMGLYVSAEVLARNPDYARVLVEEHGVGLFVIRTGFDPQAPSPHLDEAVGAVTHLGANFQLLVGTWWGAGMSNATANPMTPAASLLDYDASLAHEVQWPMVAPGGENDVPIREIIGRLCARYHPSGICLTHARFKHAADINSLFATADGSFGDAMAAAGFSRPRLAAMLRKLDRNLRRIPPEALRATTAIHFLDTVMASDYFSRWFDFRCRQIATAVSGILGPNRQCNPGVQFGTNAMGPLFSRLCGQDYRQLAGPCDFVQPLLGYMQWHVLQPIQAWATLLHEKNPSLDRDAALALSARLFGFEPAELVPARNQEDSIGAGEESAVLTMVRRQLDALEGFPPARVAPVLSEQALSPTVTAALVETVRARGFPAVLFQTADHQPWQSPAARTAPATSP